MRHIDGSMVWMVSTRAVSVWIFKGAQLVFVFGRVDIERKKNILKKYFVGQILRDATVCNQSSSNLTYYVCGLHVSIHDRSAHCILRAVQITVLRGDHLFFWEIWDLRWDMCSNLQIWALSAAYLTPGPHVCNCLLHFSESAHNLPPHIIRFYVVLHRYSSCYLRNLGAGATNTGLLSLLKCWSQHFVGSVRKYDLYQHMMQN